VSVRKIVRIDEDKCDGCGLCATACHEGAIQIVDGKARLVSEVYCDGLGDCLGECPVDAITIEEREAEAFDEKVVADHLAKTAKPGTPPGGGCPGSALRSFKPGAPQAAQNAVVTGGTSQLGQWPVQLMLVPAGAPFLKGADLLITADCVPFAVADYHAKYLAGKALVVGCPKLDDLNFYLQKLRQMFAEARPASVTVLKMEVPCCSGIANAVLQARNEVIPDTKLEVITIGIRGNELQRVEAPVG
jgi:Pyruvate/2-oxoacid:ferredoxin oxidoreductase delta subunit